MNKKYKTIKNDESDEDEGVNFPNQPLGFTVKTKCLNNFIVNINTQVKPPEHYSRVFEMMLDAGEDDLVDFFIVSPGGRLDGLSVLLEGIRLSDAHTRAILIGEASSAASILALHCGEIIVTDSAEMLCHHCLYSTGGKAADISAHVEHITKITEKLLRNTYQGFMTEPEIAALLDGKQWYFDADEIRARLEMRDKYLESKYEAEMATIAAEQVTPKPQRKKKAPQQ